MEQNVVVHIKELEKVGCAPDRRTVHSVTYRFALVLDLQHKFSNEEELARYDWLKSFMDRNSDLSV